MGRIGRSSFLISIDKNLTLEEIAETASFSMFHFLRIFKAVVSEPVAKFTRRLRLEPAQRLLQTTLIH